MSEKAGWKTRAKEEAVDYFAGQVVDVGTTQHLLTGNQARAIVYWCFDIFERHLEAQNKNNGQDRAG